MKNQRFTKEPRRYQNHNLRRSFAKWGQEAKITEPVTTDAHRKVTTNKQKLPHAQHKSTAFTFTPKGGEVGFRSAIRNKYAPKVASRMCRYIPEEKAPSRRDRHRMDVKLMKRQVVMKFPSAFGKTIV